MTKTTTAEAPSPLKIRFQCREALIEDIFCSTYGFAASEENLRSMASWLLTMNLMLDSTIRELWTTHKTGHSDKGVKAMHDWTLLNQAAAAIGDPVVSPPEAWEG